MVKNKSHTLAYSLIALQEMNLAYRYPIMFWNCACLISDAGGNDETNDEDEEEIIEELDKTYYNEMEDFTEDDEEESSYEEGEDCDGYPAEVVVTTTGKKKKKVKATNYGRIASAIGKIQSTGVRIAPPDINKSTFTFSPNVEQQVIRFGLSGITRVGEDLVKTIMGGRPYSNISDFLQRIKITKPQMINLIKAGAFDCFGDRIEIMHEYVNSISDTKKRITLQNMKMLIDFGFIPDEYDLQRRVYNFNKYLKKMKNDIYYDMDNIAFDFFSANFDIDNLVSGETESGFKIKQTIWDNIYKKQMDIIRPFVQKNQTELLNKVNERLTKDVWEKYCLGSISKWEMDSISCYIHEHELSNVNLNNYDCVDFFSLPEKPVIEKFIPIKGKQVPLYYLNRIAGTVLDRDKLKKTVTLLTTNGVVTVRIFGAVFANYDKQISEKGADGHKHVVEKSWFSRGTKLIITGIKQGENEFLAKKYSRTPYHLVELITEVNNNRLITKGERAAV